jgi:hypothetical protein
MTEIGDQKAEDRRQRTEGPDEIRDAVVAQISLGKQGVKDNIRDPQGRRQMTEDREQRE